MSRPLTRLLRVRRLMEEMSRAEFAHRRAEQAALETRREEARETALMLRGEARATMSSAAESAIAESDAVPGLWQRYLADSESSTVQMEQWSTAAGQAAIRADEAQRKYLEDRRSRMQAEILVREKMAAEQMEQQRREQRETDDWFGMGREQRSKGA